MKTLRNMLLVPAITISLASLGFAQATPATPATPASPSKKVEKSGKDEKAKIVHVTGDVVSLNKKAGTLIVKSDGKDLTITAQTQAAKKALDKIKAGETVKINGTEENGNLIARSIVSSKK